MRTKILKEKRDESIRRILDAAMEIFAESGYEGARVDEIAKRAGVNKAMIYYRIGDKEKLYEEVLHKGISKTAQYISDVIRDDYTPEEKMKIYITGVSSTIAQDSSYMPRIMMREIASGGDHFKTIVLKDLLNQLEILGEILDEGVKKKVFINMDPLVLQIMIAGTMVHFYASIPIGKRSYSLFGGKLIDPERVSPERMVQEIEKVVMRALKV